jgi:ribose-phosphate pyrophosphokinase
MREGKRLVEGVGPMAVKPDMDARAFFTPERFAQEQGKRGAPRRGRLLIASCTSATELASSVVQRYRELLSECGSEDGVLSLYDVDFRFENSETCVRLGRHVGGYDVFLFQSLVNPISGADVDHNYMAFLIAARTFREHGAHHVTAVLPYLAYSRQDKPTEFEREPTTARLMADLAIAAGIDRVIAWHPHCGQMHGFYGDVPVTFLSALSLFAEVYRRFEGREDVIAVAPDAGASHFVLHFCRALKLTGAIASKFRPSPDKAVITQIVGDFSGKNVAIILDDELSTAGTVYALAQELHEAHGIEEIYCAMSHNRCLPEARERLTHLHEKYGLRQVVVTDSIPQTQVFLELSFLTVEPLSEVLSRTINRIHYDRSVSEVFLES